MFLKVYINQNNNTKDGIICGGGSPANGANFLSRIQEFSGDIFDDYFLSDGVSEEYQLKAQSQINRILNFDSVNAFKAKKLCFFLHGWGVDSSVYDGLCLKLMNDFDCVVTFDAFGFGMSKGVVRCLCMFDYVQAFSRLICLFDCDELTLVGHSFGGKTILFLLEKMQDAEYACALRAKLKSVVLFAPSGVKPRFSLSKKLRIIKYRRLKKKCKNHPNMCEKLLKYGSDDYKNLDGEYMRQTFLSVVNTHLKLSFDEFCPRCLLVFGAKDKSTPVYMGRRLRLAIVNSKLVIVRNATHYLCLTDLSKTYGIISEFFGYN